MAETGSWFWVVYIGEICLQKRPWYRVGISSSLLALATLGGMTQIVLFLFLVASAKVAQTCAVSCCCRWWQRHHYHVTFANGNTALRPHNGHKKLPVLPNPALIFFSQSFCPRWRHWQNSWRSCQVRTIRKHHHHLHVRRESKSCRVLLFDKKTVLLTKRISL